MADTAAKTREEMVLLYKPSQWCKRMPPELVVDYHINYALTGLL